MIENSVGLSCVSQGSIKLTLKSVVVSHNVVSLCRPLMASERIWTRLERYESTLEGSLSGEP